MKQVFRYFSSGWAGWVFALPLFVFTIYAVLTSTGLYNLELKLVSDRPATVEVVYDSGTGFDDQYPQTAQIAASDGLQAIRVPIPVHGVRALRLTLEGGPAVVRVSAVSIRTRFKIWARPRVYRRFGPAAIQATPRVEEAMPDGGKVLRADVTGASPALVWVITSPTPLRLGFSWYYLMYRWVVFALGWGLLWIVGSEAARWVARLPGVAHLQLRRTTARRFGPARALWLVAAASVGLSCYPVIFCGKSFCSPNFEEGTNLLYGRFPTLPGTTDTLLANGNGADLGSMAWAHGPYAAVQSRALLQDHELPLWNRYNYSGVSLLGQGQSMFGDPLHLLVIAAGGRAWAWDTKFVLAKWLFAAGVGFLVLAATDCLPAALLLCFSSAFIGFFSYRLNHPAYFSLCYEPWILFAWLKIVRAATWRQAMRWAGGLMLANWAELNSGTAKEAYMSLACLNACGVLLVAFDRQPVRERLHRLCGLVVAGILFMMIAAPILAVFFDTLRQGKSNYDIPHVWQIQPGAVIGLFDDIFYRQFNVNEQQLEPSLNFFVGLGVLLALSHFKRLLGNRIFAVVAFCGIVPAALAFGVVPPGVIRATPLLGNVVHLGDTFSGVLFMHLFVLAGFGFRECLERADRRDWGKDVLAALLMGGALLALYFGFVQAAEDTSAVTFLKLGQEVERSRFFYGYLCSLVVAVLLLPFVLRQLWRRGWQTAPTLVLVFCLVAMHWRFGLQLPNPLSRYTPVLPNRVNLLATSPTVDLLQANQREEAFRVVGFDGNLMFGYSGVIGIEGIFGPDALINPYYRALEDQGMEEIDSWFNQPADPVRIARIKPFFDLLNVRYFLATPGQSLSEVPELTLVRQGDLDVYRNPMAWPRAFFVDRLGSYGSLGEFIAQVKEGDHRPFAAVEQAELSSLPEAVRRLSGDQSSRMVRAANHYRLTNHRTSFDLEAPSAGVVVLTEGYMKGDFVAELNGSSVPVWRVNHAFRGIVVDRPGRYRVSITYWPGYLTSALWASALGFVLCGVAGWWVWRDGTPAATSSGRASA